MKTKRDFLILVVAVLSGAASFLFYRDLIGLSEWHNWVFVVGFSGLTIAAMDYFLEAYVKKNDKLFLLPLIYCIATSALGTVGNFQVSIEKTIRSSAQYQRIEKRISALQEQQETYQNQVKRYGEENPRNQERISGKIDKNLEQQDKYEKQLASVKGAVGVTAFHRIAGRYQVNSESMLFYFLLSLGIMLDLFYCQLKIEAYRERLTKHKGGKNRQPRQPVKSVNVDSKKGKIAVDMNDPVNKEIRELLTKTNKSYREIAKEVKRSANWVMKVNKVTKARENRLPREKTNQSESNNGAENRKRMLDEFLKDYPDASLTEMANAIGVSSRETVRKYLTEMGHTGNNFSGN